MPDENADPLRFSIGGTRPTRNPTWHRRVYTLVDSFALYHQFAEARAWCKMLQGGTFLGEILACKNGFNLRSGGNGVRWTSVMSVVSEDKMERWTVTVDLPQLATGCMVALSGSSVDDGPYRARLDSCEERTA